MKMPVFFSTKTLKISRPFGKTSLLAVLLIPLYLLVLEGLIRINIIPASILVPSIDRELNYSEIDIKLSRLNALETGQRVNCFILGSSMVDFGLDAAAINRQTQVAGIESPVCFNMALKAMKPEVIAKITDILIKQSKPTLIILGISPNDFTGGQDVIRKFVHAPWVQYQEGNPSLEGWWIEHSQTYRCWLAFMKYRDPAYRSDVKNQLSMIDPYGSQVSEKDFRMYRVESPTAPPDFHFSQNDLDGFNHIINLNSATLKVVVVEMPVHPDFLPYYIPGGEAGYETQFIRPVEAMLGRKGIPFIRTQQQIGDSVTLDGWKDYLHLNKVGMDQFSRWLAEKLGNFKK